MTRGNAMAIWDIAEQPAKEQFDFWHDVICDVFIPMTPQRSEPGHGFAGRVEARPFGSVTRTDVGSEPQRTIHGPREIAQSDGEFYFLEVAARVGGAHIAETLEAARGHNLWREWARIEVAGERGVYEVPPHREDYAGICISLARQEWPDTSGYDDP